MAACVCSRNRVAGETKVRNAFVNRARMRRRALLQEEYSCDVAAQFLPLCSPRGRVSDAIVKFSIVLSLVDFWVTVKVDVPI